MSAFFEFLSTFLWCGTIFGLASVVALSLPQSRLRVVLKEFLSWAFVALCAIYVVMPVDLLPEAALGPFGFLDDLGAIVAGYMKVKEGLRLHAERKEWDRLVTIDHDSDSED